MSKKSMTVELEEYEQTKKTETKEYTKEEILKSKQIFTNVEKDMLRTMLKDKKYKIEEIREILKIEKEREIR